MWPVRSSPQYAGLTSVRTCCSRMLRLRHNFRTVILSIHTHILASSAENRPKSRTWDTPALTGTFLSAYRSTTFLLSACRARAMQGLHTKVVLQRSAWLVPEVHLRRVRGQQESFLE